MKKIYAIGDIHGDIDRFKLLMSKNNLIDADENWNVGDSTFVSIGDVTDRGKYGIKVIEFIMKLEEQAKKQGGEFITLCGNHDALIASIAYEEQGEFINYDCRDIFQYNGGRIDEVNKIVADDELFNWIKNRPLMYKIGNLLFQHADTAKYYLSLGDTVEEINTIGLKMLQSGEGSWKIFYDMCDCRFWDRNLFLKYTELENHINNYMDHFDVNIICHGHTRFKGNSPQLYHNNSIINLDGSMSEGYRNDPDRGFIVSFTENEENCFVLN